MARFLCGLSILIASLCLFSSNVAAQTATTTPLTCPNATSMANVNTTNILGNWYEVARSPAGVSQCILTNLSISSDNSTLTIKTTYSANLAQLSSNVTMSDSISLNTSPNNATYNVTYSMSGTASKTTTTIKLLASDYNNYAIICGYANASDPSTHWGAILTRLRVPTAANLTQYEAQATSQYADFSNLTAITQSAKCYTNAASSTIPIFSTIFIALYAILKYLN